MNPTVDYAARKAMRESLSAIDQQKLRDRFAGQALLGMRSYLFTPETRETAARCAYDMADAMMAERKRRQKAERA